MNPALIKIAYRQVITNSSEGIFEKYVFNNSYNEFLLKSQAYNPQGKFKTFTEIKCNDGRANSLHYKTGFSIDGFVSNLENVIPGIMDTHEKPIIFETYKFELIESHLTEKKFHKIALFYYTEIMTLLDNLEAYLLLSPSDKSKEHTAGKPIEDTFMLKIQPGLSISSYREIISPVNLSVNN